MPINPEVQKAATEFGLHVRQGGWRLGWLVATSVKEGNGQGARQPRNDRNEVGKISASEFAKRSGTSTPRVMRYVKAWERAAKDGVVPSADELLPGEELQNFLEVNLGPWTDYFDSAAHPMPEPREERIVEQARESGVGAGKIREIVRNPKAVAAAIKADPEARIAAREALHESDAKQASGRQRREIITDRIGPSAMEQGDQVLAALRSVRRSMQQALTVVTTNGVRSGIHRQNAEDLLIDLSNYLEALRQAVHGEALEDELAELLKGEPQ